MPSLEGPLLSSPLLSRSPAAQSLGPSLAASVHPAARRSAGSRGQGALWQATDAKRKPPCLRRHRRSPGRREPTTLNVAAKPKSLDFHIKIQQRRKAYIIRRLAGVSDVSRMKSSLVKVRSWSRIASVRGCLQKTFHPLQKSDGVSCSNFRNEERFGACGVPLLPTWSPWRHARLCRGPLAYIRRNCVFRSRTGKLQSFFQLLQLATYSLYYTFQMAKC